MRTVPRQLLAIISIIAAISFGGLTFVPAAVASPTTFTVNSVGDGADANAGDGLCDVGEGECTLRAAIEEANANAGADTIEFNIPGTGVHTIEVPAGEDFPLISDSVTIDGFTQPGSAENTAASPAPNNAIYTIEVVRGAGEFDEDAVGLNIDADDSVIQGISIHDFGTDIYVSGDGEETSIENVTIKGNFIGTDPTGLRTSNQFESGIGISYADNTTVGGDSPDDRNIIGGGDTGVNSHGTHTFIYGNYIGVGRDGVTDLIEQVDPVSGGNGIQQSFSLSPDESSYLTVGGPDSDQRNVIAGYDGLEINIMSSDNTIQGNYIGTDYTGVPNDNLVSGFGMVMTFNASGNLIGGDDPADANTIAGTGGVGVGVVSLNLESMSMVTTPINNAILGNSIFDVHVTGAYGFASTNAGIDLVQGTFEGDPDGAPNSFQFAGPTPNDDGDSDTGANNFMNAPILKTAQQIDDNLNVTFDLDVADSDSNQYRVEFFSNDVPTIFGTGPGQTYLGTTTVSNGANKTASLTLPGDLDITNKALSATVTPVLSTSPTGFGGTSEFAQNIEVGTAQDFDADGISDAIEDAAPNDGDANDDGIADSHQSTVTSFVSAASGVYTTFEIGNGCFSNGYVDSVASNTLGTDTGWDYPYGMTDFSLNCSAGDTVTINKYIYSSETDVEDFSIRKFNPNTDTFISADDIPGADPTIESTTVGGQHVIHLEYTLTDGQLGDDDLDANGIIVDPVGLAAVHVDSQQATNSGSSNNANLNTSNSTSAQGTLSSTGAHRVDDQTSTALWSLVLGLLLVALTRMRSRRLFNLRHLNIKFNFDFF
jgi:CSLREA domain-containing protein